MKQFHEIGTQKSDYGTKLTVSTLLFAFAQGTKADRTFGLKLEHEDRDARIESCLIDFDEVKELLLAIKHLLGMAKQMAAEQIDYTEFEYVTRDSLKVGFYQNTDGQQQAFFDVSPGGSFMFLTFDQLRNVFELIRKGREYLIEKGATSNSEISQAGS